MTADVATELLPAPVASLGVEAESWLQELTAASPDQPIVWCPHGYRRSGTAVRNVEHLSVLVSSLPEPGEWAVVEWADGDVRRWCQTMRYPTGWVVDAHDGNPEAERAPPGLRLRAVAAVRRCRPDVDLAARQSAVCPRAARGP